MKHVLRKIFALSLVFCFLFFSPSVLSIVEAAVSPWTQSNWSGGSGQTAWSDTTKFSSSSNAAVTSTPNQVTFTGSEKLTNTGLESDLSNWTQTAENDTTGVFSSTNFLADSSPISAWPLGDTTSTQSYSQVFNPATSAGRNTILNGTLDTDTIWTKGTGWTIAGGVAHSDGTGSFANLNQTQTFVTGKAYSVTFTVSNYVSGSIEAFVGGGITGHGTARSANGTFTENIICGTSPTGFFLQTTTTFVGDIDNVTVTQVNIPASSATSATQLLTDGDMETAGVASWIVGNTAALSKDPSTPHSGTQSLKVARNGTNNPQAKQTVLTIGTTYRVTGYARGDGTSIPTMGTVVANKFTGTNSTAWQPFDVVFVADGTNLFLTATNITVDGQYAEFDDVTVSLDNYIRPGELLTDGDMEASGTTNWTVLNNATVTKDNSAPHGGTSALKIAGDGVSTAGVSQAAFAIGKTYHVTGWAKGDGTATPRLQDGSTSFFSGTTSTTWQQIDVTFVPTTVNFRIGSTNVNSAGNFTEWDDMSLTEVNPLVGKPTNGVAFPTASGGHLTNAYSFDGSNDVVNIYSSDLNSAFNPSEGSIVIWAKVSGSGVWSDGIQRTLIHIRVDGSNDMNIKKQTSNLMQFVYTAGGVIKSLAFAISPAGWTQYALTWNKSSDQAIFYINGIQNGATQTGLGTWAGNFNSTQTIVGAFDSSGSTPWSGLINDVRLYGRALSATEILNQYNGFTTTRDTGTKFAGTASMKTVAEGHSKVDITQSVNVGDTQSYYLSAYAYTDGSAVTSSDAELFYNGSTVTTTYTAAGGGWYQLTGIVTGANASKNYGVQTKSGKTVFLDNFGLKEASATVTSSIFDTGPAGSLGTNYGNVNFVAAVPTNTTATVKVRTSNSSDMTGATDFSGCNSLSTAQSIQASNCVVNGQRYVQYQLVLSNTDGSSTPTFNSVTLDFSAINTSVSPSTPACTDQTPTSTPIISSILPLDPNTLKIIFSKVSPVSSYSLRYGDISGNYKWGVANFGDSNSTSYNVGLLAPNTTYYFEVRAQNGCTTSSWSSEVSGKTSSGTSTQQTPPIVTAPVPSTTKIPTVTPTPTPTTGGTGPLPPEKPGGITLPTIDTKPISEFIQNNLNAISSWWNQVTSNIQQSFIAVSGGIERIREGSFTLLASLFNGIEKGLTTVSGSLAYQTNNLVKTVNRGTETYLTNVNTSLTAARGNIQNLSFNATTNLIRSDIRSVSFMSRSAVTLTALSGSATNYLSSLSKTSMNTLAEVVRNGVKNTTSVINGIGKSFSNLAMYAGNTTRAIANSIGNQIALVASSTVKTINQSLVVINKNISRLTNAVSTQLAFVFEGANKAVTKVQTFLAISGEYWLDKEPTKIISVKIENISPTSAVISWQTNEYSSSAVNYGLDTSYGNRAQVSELTKDHKVEIANLEPNKTYFFEVMSQGKTYVYDSYYTFQTSSGPNQLVKKAKIEIIGNQNDWILVRNAPTKEGGVVAKVQVGEKFQLLMEKNGWYLIKLDGSEGWISKDLGKLIE